MTRLMVIPIELDTHRESFDLFVAGDMHYNHPGCELDSFISWRDEVVENVQYGRKTHAILMGDYCTVFPKDDKRRNPDNKRSSAITSYTKIRDLVKPIKDVTSCMLAGNHDEDWWISENNDYVNWICVELGIPYGSYESIIRYKIVNKVGGNKRNLDVVAWHGSGGSRTRGGAINAAARPLDTFKTADIVLMGHLHRMGMLREQWLEPNERLMDVVANNQYIVMTGGYQKGFIPERSTYISKKMLPPVTIGGVKLTIKPFKNVRNRDVVDVVLHQIY